MKKVKLFFPITRKIVLALLVFCVAAACTEDKEVKPRTITDIVLENNDFTILRNVLLYAEMGDALKTSNITVFAPNDAAFKASGYGDASALTALPPATVRQILEYHILGETVAASGLATGTTMSVQSIGQKPLYFTRNASVLTVNGARVVTADLKANNGVIHVIDRVLIPADQTLLGLIQSNPDFTFLAAAAARAATANPAVANALTSTTTAFTVFAPTNQAFIAAGFPSIASLSTTNATTLANILLYHVLPGRVFTTNLVSGTTPTANSMSVRIDANDPIKITSTKNGSQSATVTKANVLATNGVLHVIDRVLVP